MNDEEGKRGAAEYSDRPGQRPSYRVSEDPGEVAKEQQRLSMLGEMWDRRSAVILEKLGLGPGCWLIPSEVFYNAIRMRAMTLATFANRVTTTGVVATAISIQDAWSWSGFFAWYGSTALVAAAFLFAYLPETKGRSLEAMYAHFEDITGSRDPAKVLVPPRGADPTKVV